jgi:integrase
MVERIKSGQFERVLKASAGTTIMDLKPHYLVDLKERGVGPLDEISYKDGQAYFAKRRATEAADETIAREWSVLHSLLNFAVKVGELPANPLQGVTTPKSGARNRMPTPGGYANIAAIATDRLRRAATLAMNCGLREEKVWAIKASSILLKADGPWLELPAPRSKKKGNPLLIPLNRYAYAALTIGDKHDRDERIFSEWSDKGALSKAWARAQKRWRNGSSGRSRVQKHVF